MAYTNKIEELRNLYDYYTALGETEAKEKKIILRR